MMYALDLYETSPLGNTFFTAGIWYTEQSPDSFFSLTLSEHMGSGLYYAHSLKHISIAFWGIITIQYCYMMNFG